MFNLSSYRTENLADILRRELSVTEVNRLDSGLYQARIGDESVNGTLQYIKECIKAAISELIKSSSHLWNDLSHLCEIIADSNGHNSGAMPNAVFLHSVQRACALSGTFSDLRDINLSIKKLFYIDIETVDDDLVQKFNLTYLRIRLIHHLILREFYRLRVINIYLRNVKIAQISGPWANLDLPMKERMWEWNDEEAEYFASREQARKEQIRYNPENDKYGFYFIWQDLTRDPYRFEDMEEDSPYKSRHLLTQP